MGKAFVAVSTLLSVAAAAVISPYAGYAGAPLAYANYAAAAPAPIVHAAPIVVNPYDYAGQVYPAAVPYVHEDVAAEEYVHEDIEAVPYVHEDIAAEPYVHEDIEAVPYVHEDIAP